MLEVLIKRDGREEPLIPNKLNGWSAWASEKLGDRVDWSKAALDAVASLPKRASTRELMTELINKLLTMESYPAYMMAGRLFATVYRKDVFGSMDTPSVWELQSRLIKLGRMRALPYSDEEYVQINEMIMHERDFSYPEFSLKHLRDKYALKNFKTGEIYETPQFIYIRLAMELASKEPEHERLNFVKRYYDKFSMKRMSAPTPNYLYLGTEHRGWASCCIYTSDDNAKSLAIGDHIAYMMTVNSAGLGSFINTRTVGDPIDNGRVEHAGKYRYLKAAAEATIANKQAGRGGAGTTYYSGFDPEAMDIVKYRNPMQPEDKRLRELHFALLFNSFFAMKVQKAEDVMVFTSHSAPDLFDAMFSPDIKEFVRLYRQYEADPNFEKKYISPRKLIMTNFGEAFTTGTAYSANIEEMNRHTPFKISKNHRIHSSNLCLEICEIQAPYYDMMDLYSSHDHGRGEIAMCNLGAIPIENITSDEDYYEATYLSLKMIDYTILNSEYPFPHLAFTAKQRMNAAVGIMGLATHMARKGLKYNSTEGYQELHRVYERHMYMLIKASLAISKERGLAPWIHKTKWPEGWTPFETYKKSVDTIAPFENQYDWEQLSQEIKDNGGLAHSTLCAFMPGETSSKALGSSNSIYPVREPVLVKKDGDNVILRWAAIDSDLLDYQSAFDLTMLEQIKMYAIAQKWCDHAPSADFYKRFKKANETVGEEEVIETFLNMVKYGMKTKYYTNTQTPKAASLEDNVSLIHDAGYIPEKKQDKESMQSDSSDYISNDPSATSGCQDGFCTL